MLKMEEDQGQHFPVEQSHYQTIHQPMDSKILGPPSSYVPPSVRSFDSGDDDVGDSPQHSQADATSSDNEDATVLTASSSGAGEDDEKKEETISHEISGSDDDGPAATTGTTEPLSPTAEISPEMFQNFLAGPGKEMFKKMLQEQVQELQGSVHGDQSPRRRDSEASSLDSFQERAPVRHHPRRASTLSDLSAGFRDEPNISRPMAPTIHGNVSSTETVVGPFVSGGLSARRAETNIGVIPSPIEKQAPSSSFRTDSERRKMSVHFQDDDGKVVPARPTGASIELSAVDRSWGELFSKEGLPTPRFRAVMKALACYIIERFLPVNSLVVTPQKLFYFYSTYSVDKEKLPLTDIFQPQTQENFSKIDNAFHHLQLQYHLIQDEPRRRKTPTVPALTPDGFAEWMILMAQACPDEEARRLQLVFRDLPVELKEGTSRSGLSEQPNTASGGWERLPRQISRHLLPATANGEKMKALRTAFWDMLPDHRPKKHFQLPAIFRNRDKDKDEHREKPSAAGSGSSTAARTAVPPSSSRRHHQLSSFSSTQHADDTGSPDPYDRTRMHHSSGRTRSRRESHSSTATTSPSSPRSSFRSGAADAEFMPPSTTGEGRAASVAAVVPRRNRSPVSRGFRASLPEVHVSQGHVPGPSSLSSAALAYAPPGVAYGGTGEELGPMSPVFETPGVRESRSKRDGHRRERDHEARVYASPRTSRGSVDEGRPGEQRETWAEYQQRQ